MAGPGDLRGPVPKRGGRKVVKIKIFGPVLRGFSPEIDPRDPLRSTGRTPDINLHQRSAPETNSKAISLWARGVVCFRMQPHGATLTRGSLKGEPCEDVGLSGAVEEIDGGWCLGHGEVRTAVL